MDVTYPLDMTKTGKASQHESTTGHAVANDVDEHKKLSELGYEPKLEPKEKKPAK